MGRKESDCGDALYHIYTVGRLRRLALPKMLSIHASKSLCRALAHLTVSQECGPASEMNLFQQLGIFWLQGVPY